jgi:hypothetical protein
MSAEISVKYSKTTKSYKTPYPRTKKSPKNKRTQPKKIRRNQKKKKKKIVLQGGLSLSLLLVESRDLAIDDSKADSSFHRLHESDSNQKPKRQKKKTEEAMPTSTKHINFVDAFGRSNRPWVWLVPFAVWVFFFLSRRRKKRLEGEE